MAIQVACPTCEAQLLIDDVSARAVRCPQCNGVVNLGSLSGDSTTIRRKLPARTGGVDSTVQKRVPPEPPPEFFAEEDSKTVLLNLGQWLTLVLATLCAIGAVVVPVLGVQSPAAGYVLGGGAIGLGLFSSLLAVLARSATLASALAVLTMGVVSCIFVANFTLAQRKIAQERNEVEASPRMILDEAKTLLQEIAPRSKTLEADKLQLQKDRDRLNGDAAKLDAAKRNFDQTAAKVEEERKQIESEKEAVARRIKTAEASEAQTSQRLKLAEAKETEADNKLKATEATLKKVKDAIDGVRGKLKSSDAEQRKTAIAALTKLGPIAAEADSSLCYLIANESQEIIKRDALIALKQVKPEVHNMAAAFAQPLRGDWVAAHREAIAEVPSHGKAGLPFIAREIELSGKVLEDLNADQLTELVWANVNALSKLAAKDEQALELLVKIMESPLALQRHKKIGSLGIYTKEIAGRIPAILSPQSRETREKTAQNCTALLKSNVTENRLLGVIIMGWLGPSARAELPLLRTLSHDPDSTVRETANQAIVAVDKGGL